MDAGKDRDPKLLAKAAVIFVALALALVVFFNFVAHYVHRNSLLKVTFKTATGESAPFYLTIASTPQEREVGLMYKSSMPKDEGMLFVFPEETPLSFWMKNTYIPLDMIFIDKDLNVQGVVENAEILTEAPRSIPGIKSKYLIELNAGLSRAAGIAEGAKVIADGPIPEGVANRKAKS